MSTQEKMPSRKSAQVKWGVVLSAVVTGIAGILVAYGFDEKTVGAFSLMLITVIGYLTGQNIKAIATEDAAHKQATGTAYTPPVDVIRRHVEDHTRELRDQASQQIEAARQTAVRAIGNTVEQVGKTVEARVAEALKNARGLVKCLLMGALLLPMVSTQMACAVPQDRVVERHLGDLRADLKYRGEWERARIRAEFAQYRARKHAEIDQAHLAALRFLELNGKLTADASQRVAQRFALAHDQLDARVDAALAISLRSCEWYELAAETIGGAVEYYQAKDQAWAEFGQGAIEGFARSYAITRSENPDETERRAQDLIGQINGELLSMLEGRLGPPGAMGSTGARSQ